MKNYDKCQKYLTGRNRMEDLFSVCGKIRLRKGEGRTLKAGGAWIYDNEIEWMSDGIIDGHLVEVLDFDDYFMGIGFINRKSKITVRMLARHTDVVVTPTEMTGSTGLHAGTGTSSDGIDRNIACQHQILG